MCSVLWHYSRKQVNDASKIKYKHRQKNGINGILSHGFYKHIIGIFLNDLDIATATYFAESYL